MVRSIRAVASATVVLCMLTTLPGEVCHGLSGAAGLAGDDSTAEAFRAALRTLTSPQMEVRKQQRRKIQQRGYAAILSEVLRQDAAGALIMALRTRAQLDYGLPSHTLYAVVPVRAPDRDSGPLSILHPPSSPPLMIPLVEDFTFPTDPWAP